MLLVGRGFGTTGDSGPGEVTKELLPNTYPFKMDYSGESKQKNGTVLVGPGSLLTFSWDGIDLSRLAGEEGVYRIENNYPNPFDRSTMINYSIPEDKKVSLIIYDWNGKQVKVLVDEFKDSGDYQVEWNARDESGNLVPGGMYYYQFKSGTLIETKIMVRVH